MPVIAMPPYRRIHDYEEAVRLAGGTPRVLDLTVERPADVVASSDGILIPGGGDVDPAQYGEARHRTFEAAEEGRDEFELELVRLALEADLPLLAICRGLQVLNVARGGSLVQDIPEQVADAGVHVVREPATAIVHRVDVVPGTRLEGLLRSQLTGGSCAVNSRHHQAIKDVGDGLVVTATAPDGVVEAAEDPSRRFCVGVQWHPENFYRTGEFSELFKGFLAAVRS